MLSYYITDRMLFAGDESERRSQLLHSIGQAAVAGVDYIQLREKDLTASELERLGRETLAAMRAHGHSRLLINHRTDVALAIGADGVHLTGSDLAASDVRALLASVRSRSPAEFLVAVSCHSAAEVRLAESHGADFAVLAPIFEKSGDSSRAVGLEELRCAAQKDRAPDLRVEAGDTRRRFAVFALGGLTVERAQFCAQAGAMGVAAIRLFQQAGNLPALLSRIRTL